jgi:ATP-dependent Clp endopeptidase proteolytic subunit ClpP
MRSLFAHRSSQPLMRESGGAVEMLLYDEIGMFGISAKAFAATLKSVDADTIHLRVNSPGGDVFDGIAIYNALRQHPAKVVTHIDGLAASISSVIALAGDEVTIAPNAFFMIHNPWGVTVGDAEIHRKMADTLDKIAHGSIISTYQARTGLGVETIETWMDDETWFSAEQAAEAGFVDAVEDAAPAARALPFDLSVYQHVPVGLEYGAPDDELTIDQVRDLEGRLRERDVSQEQAERAIAAFKRWLRGEPGASDHTRREGAGGDADAAKAANDLLANLGVASLRKFGG